MPRRRFRDPDPQIRDRNKWDATGQPAVGGLSRIGGAGAARPSISVRSGSPGAAATVVEHVTLRATNNQTVANGGDDVIFNRFDATPVEARGFGSLQDELASAGEVTDIPIDVTGVAVVEVELLYQTYRAGGTVTITRTRGGQTAVYELESGPLTSRWFAGSTTVGLEVRTGDTLTVGVPNSSGAGVTLTSGRVEVAVWALAPITSTVTPSVGAPGGTPYAWWRGDQITGYAEGAAMTGSASWPNLVGDSAAAGDAGTPGDEPTYVAEAINERPAARFTDGTKRLRADLWEHVADELDLPCTLAWVFKLDSTSAGQFITTTRSAGFFDGLLRTTASGFELDGSDFSVTLDTDWHFLIVQIAADKSTTWYLDGASGVSGVGAASDGPIESSYEFGAPLTSSSAGFSGYLAEHIVWDDPLSSEDVEQTVGYFQSRYGI